MIPKRHDWDAIIVGAGPAGASCALDLARHGRRVLLLEKESWPRYKTCGGGLIWRARRLLDPTIDIDALAAHRTRRAELHLHDLDRTFAVDRDLPFVTMTMRAELDSLLVDAAQRVGTTFVSECKVSGLELQHGRWALDSAGVLLSARHVVAADGAGSTVARLCGWPDQPRPVPALEAEVEVDSPTYRRFQTLCRFDFELVPMGYAWVFPKLRHLSVGCLSPQPGAHTLRHWLDRYLAELDIHPLQRQDHGFVIPARPRAARLAQNGVLLTGDAAGLADPVTFEGISNAIWSGRLAAEAIATERATAATDAYQSALQTRILPELRAARLLAQLVYRMPRLRRLAFDRVGQRLTGAVADIMTGDRTYRSLLTSPTSYLRAASSLLRIKR